MTKVLNFGSMKESFLKREQQLGMIVHASNPSTWEVEA
jgi:hypothetical protein